MCWEKRPSARPSIDAVSICLKEAVKTWVVDVPAFMLASRAGVEQVMNLKEDQAKDFADRLDEVRSRKSRSRRSIGALIVTSHPDTGPDRYQPAHGEDLLEVSPETMWRLRCFTGLVHAHGGVRSH